MDALRVKPPTSFGLHRYGYRTFLSKFFVRCRFVCPRSPDQLLMPPWKGPAWAEYTVLKSSTHRNTLVRCKHCQAEFNATYTRLLAHLIGEAGVGIRPCPNVPDRVLERLRQTALAKAAEKTRQASLQQLDASTSADSAAGAPASSSQRPQSRQRTIGEVTNRAGKAAVRGLHFFLCAVLLSASRVTFDATSGRERSCARSLLALGKWLCAAGACPFRRLAAAHTVAPAAAYCSVRWMLR